MATQPLGTPRIAQDTNRLLSYPKPIPLKRLTTTPQIIYTADAKQFFMIQHLWVAEAAGESADYSIFLVPPAGTPDATTAIVFNAPLDENASLPVPSCINALLRAGYTLQASATGTVNVGGWGWDYSGQFG